MLVGHRNALACCFSAYEQHQGCLFLDHWSWQSWLIREIDIFRQHNSFVRSTLVPKNLCAIILSTIYLSTKNLGRKFKLIWVAKNLGTNSSKNERFSTKISIRHLPQFIIILYYSSHFAFNCNHVGLGGSPSCFTMWNLRSAQVLYTLKLYKNCFTAKNWTG